MRRVLLALLTAAAVAVPCAACAGSPSCPGSTSWDNLLQRCV